MSTMTKPERAATVFNLPNQLTASRLVLAVILFALIAYQAWLSALCVFAVAAFTDWLDGYLARVQGLTSSFGRMLDPLVDKVLISGAFIFLLPFGTPAGWLTPWMVVVVVAREFLITGLRSYLEQLGVQFGADWLGKLKMVLQCAAISAILVSLHDSRDEVAWLRDLLIWAMLSITILSGAQYFWKGYQKLTTE